MRSTLAHNRAESTDEANLVVALLVRFPQIATLVSHPGEGTLTLSFALRRRLDRRAQSALAEAIVEHVRALPAAGTETPERVEVACEADEGMTFVRVVRDAQSVSREELEMLTALMGARFGDALVESEAASAEESDDPEGDAEIVELALEGLRDPSQSKSLLGFREEKRVMVYFVSARKKPKARARS